MPNRDSTTGRFTSGGGGGGGGGGFNLGNAYGAVIIDVSGVGSAMRQAQSAISSGLQGVGTSISNTVKGIGDSLTGIGNNIATIGAKMAAIGAPIALGFQQAIGEAMDFDESVTNIAAVLNLTQDEADALGEKLKNVGVNSRAGAQQVAQAFYDIAGGVADASTHMAILDAAIKTSEAGNSNLAGTTNALISVMNSYNLSADQAAMVSDVLTRTVGMGVGTMDQFAAAFPAVTGIANSLGISFENLGQMMAYLTTKGNTASEAATQLSSLMTAMLKPNNDMADALAELGFSSGEAAVQQLGLVGAFQAIAGTQKAAEKGMGTLIGRVEGIRAVTSFGSKDVENFFDKYTKGVKGATDAAQKIQNQSMAAKWDRLNSRIQDVAITLGTTLFPILTELLEKITPIIYSISEWIKQNPELVQQIALIVGGLVVLGPIIAAVGFAISTVGSIISGIGTVIGILTSGPLLLLGGAIAAIAIAFPEGFQRILDGIGYFVDDVKKFGIGQAILMAFGIGTDGKGSWVEGVLVAFGMSRDGAHDMVEKIGEFLLHFNDNVKLYGSLIKLYAEYYFQGVVLAIQKVIDKIVDFLIQNPQLFDAIVVVSGVLLVLGGVMLVASGLAWAFSVAMAAVGTVVAVGGGLLTGISGFIALLTGPLGLVALLVALVGAVVIGYPGGFPGLLKDAATSFGLLLKTIDVAFLTWVKNLAQSFHDLAVNLGLATDASARWSAGANQFSSGGATSGGGSGGGSSGFGNFGNAIAAIPPVGGGSAAPRDIGGAGMTGMAYQIGSGQMRNEVYIPGADGQFVSDFVDLMKQVAANVGGQGSGQQFGDINVMMPPAALANPAAAYAAGQDFGRGIQDEMQARGVKPIR